MLFVYRNFFISVFRYIVVVVVNIVDVVVAAVAGKAYVKSVNEKRGKSEIVVETQIQQWQTMNSFSMMLMNSVTLLASK